MTYSETLARIHSLDKFGSRPGLDRINALLDLMGRPQDSLRFVHVAGTNGKGSVCMLLSSVLTQAHYKTGLFISPFITDFCERIQINNTPIPHDELSAVCSKLFAMLDILNESGIIITEFEFVMAAAFEYFYQQGCDIVVLETGLGGLLDCTNVILPPLCSVITRIGLDHTAVLGDTIELIAGQKCGIIKPGSPVVSSTQTEKVTQIIKAAAEKTNSNLYFGDSSELTVLYSGLDSTRLDYGGLPLTLKLTGSHQVENAACALTALRVLRETAGIRFSDRELSMGFAAARNPGRLELMCADPVVLLDGAHNPNGIAAFAAAVNTFTPRKGRTLIIGMLSDKDSRTSASLLGGMFDSVFTVPVSNPRSLSSRELCALCKSYFDNVTAFDSAAEAFDTAYSAVRQSGGTLCICGSLYLAGELRPHIIQAVK